MWRLESWLIFRVVFQTIVIVKLLSRVQLFATPWTVAHQALLSIRFPRQEYQSGLPFSCSRRSSRPRVWTPGLWHCRQTLYHLRHQGSPLKVKITQLCLTLFDSMDWGLPGSSVHGLLQARILEWVAIPFLRGSSQPRDQTQVSHIADRFFTIWATKEGLVVRKSSTHTMSLYALSLDQ